ncbi:MAG TPA: peptidoglycan DD-metalloendopeptidase family protein [Candidatus Limnocylindrales bacterium]
MISRLVAPRSAAAVAAASGASLIPGLDEAAAAAIDARRVATRQATSAARRPNPKLRRGRLARLFALVVLITPLLVGSIGTYSAPPPTRGDELSAALASQKALAAKIKAQKAAIANLAALQAGLASDIGQTQTALAGVNLDLTAVQKRVTKLNANIKIVQTAYAGLVAQLADLNWQLVQITASEQEKATQLAARKALLAQRLQAAYEAGEPSLLEVVLGADSFTTALSDVSNQLALGDRDKALADQIAADQATLATLHQTVSDTAAATDDLRVQTAAQKASLAARVADLKVAKAQLKVLQAETRRQLALQRQAYLKLAQNKVRAAQILALEARTAKSLKAKIARLVAAQFAGGNIPSVYNGSLDWPLAGTVTQEFGCTGVPQEPPMGNCRHFHIGIDIADPMYTPIRAAGDGRVVYEDPLSDGAWVVIIAHSKDLVTLYGHVDNRRHPPVVRAGQMVAKGQIIAFVGMTGNTTGPHLHWGVEFQNVWRNPRLFV